VFITLSNQRQIPAPLRQPGLPAYPVKQPTARPAATRTKQQFKAYHRMKQTSARMPQQGTPPYW